MAKKSIKTVYRAKATEKVIEDVIAADQGNSFRASLKNHIMEQEDAFRQNEDGFRSHLGASLIGGHCERALWYGFRWATIKTFPGRIVRLFNRGHLEEARFIAMLEAIGCTVYQINADGTQFRMSGHGGHYGGSLDAVVTGLPDWPNSAVLAEFKTHNDNSFKALEKDGVAKAKPEHAAQMQQYMAAYKLPAAVYMAVNKNDDSLYCEILHADSNEAADDYAKAGRIIFSDAPPPRVSESPGWFACKWCDHNAVCHTGEAVAKSCRTCAYVTPKEDGTWICENEGCIAEAELQGWADPIVLDKEAQALACAYYEPFTAYVED